MIKERPVTLQRLAAPSLLLAALLLSAPAAGQFADGLILEARPLSSGEDSLRPSIDPRLGLPSPGRQGSAAEQGGAVLQGSVERYLEAIEALEAENERYSPDYRENLQSLGVLYQRQGEHEQALDYLEQARVVTRMNNGLFSMEQAPILERRIDSLLALGREGEAWQEQEILLSLYEENYGDHDMRAVPLYTRMANWQFDSFNAIIAAGRQPVFNVGRGRNSLAGAFLPLFRAQRHYFQAIATIVQNREWLHPDLPSLERRLIATWYLQSNRSRIWEDTEFYSSPAASTGSRIRRTNGLRNSPAYHVGSDSYSRILLYLWNDPDTSVDELAGAMLEFGDWHLMYGRRRAAEEQYREAAELLGAAGLPPQQVEALLAPEVPVSLPAFLAQPHTREKYGIPPDAPLRYDGHLDLNFELTRSGKARSVDILASSDGTPGEVEDRLRRILREATFRPRIVDGEVQVPGQHAVRYYYSNPEAD